MKRTRANAWMEEVRINGKPSIIRMLCKACDASEQVEVFSLSEQFRPLAIDALRKSFAKIHRDCRHLRAVQ